MTPFGVREIVSQVGGAESVLDAGCGSARLTLALAEAGADEVVGIDTSSERLAQGRQRIAEAGATDRVSLLECDFNAPLPFDDRRFGAVTSRLSLMIAGDPSATLRELGRVTVPGGPVVTALWAPTSENPWFALPREAAAAVLGAGRADYARAFGRLGDPAEASAAHAAAGLTGARAEILVEHLELPDAAALWAWLAAENGHVRRLDAELSDDERAAVLRDLAARTAPYRTAEGGLRLPRTMTLVVAHAPA